MTLTLDVVAVEGQASRGDSCVFTADGGTIGRNADSTWVLSNPKVSGRHADIRCYGDDFYIVDQSRNGVCLNGLDRRLEKDREYPLSDGDVLYIDPYEIRVKVSQQRARSPLPSRRGGAEDWLGPRNQSDPFPSDPFAPAHEPARSPLPEEPDASRADLDPIGLLGLQEEQRRKARTSRDLEQGGFLEDSYRPQDIVQEPSSPRTPAPNVPPANYNPLESKVFSQPLVPAPRPSPGPKANPPAPTPVSPRPETKPPFDPPRPAPLPPPLPRPWPVASAEQGPAEPSAPVPVRPIAPPVPVSPTGELAAVLAGAGLDPALATPELARQIGAIIRVVVAGVMDVLQVRAEVKDAFDLKRTVFRPLENNPLKFSANIDDALHNLLVKRNAAYLGPVDAFEDAFDDLRQHQVAMLAGIRVAFDGLLAEFDPERLQAEFDRVAGKGLVPAKLRYWELYKERAQALVRDPDTSFKRLFAEAFARAYAEQLALVKGRGHTSDETSAFHVRRDDEP